MDRSDKIDRMERQTRWNLSQIIPDFQNITEAALPILANWNFFPKELHRSWKFFMMGTY